MVRGLRRRLAADGGMSLVEVLVAMFVLTVALLALLGSLMASARSVSDQRGHSAATRVATEYLDELRGRGFADLRTSASTTPTLTEVRVRGGRSYTITTALAETAAGQITGDPKVIQVTSTVTWSDLGQPESIMFSTAVAPGDVTAAGPAQGIVSVNFTPPTVVVNSAGVPTTDVALTVVLDGFDASALVTASWFNSPGAGSGSKTLTSADGGITWEGSIARPLITRAVASGETAPGLEFTVMASTQQTRATLPLALEVDTPPTFTSASVSPTQLTVENDNNCNNDDKCENRTPIELVALVTGLRTDQDTVRVKYELHDGRFQEVALVWDAGTSSYKTTLPADSVQLKTGPSQSFTFTARRTEDNGTASVTVSKTVVAT